MLHNYQLSSKIQYNGDVSLVSVSSIRTHVFVLVLRAEFQDILR
jgi:hypothetical protein